MLNLFIAIIVNAMQSHSEQEQEKTIQAVEQVLTHTETDLHADVRAMRAEIHQLKMLLMHGAVQSTDVNLSTSTQHTTHEK